MRAGKRVSDSLRNGPSKDGKASAATTAKSAANTARSLLRRLSPEQFTQRDFARLVAAVIDAGIALLPIDEFCSRYEDYFGAQDDWAPSADAMFGHFKFDIHGDIKRPVELAQILKDRNAHGLFLIMHRHPLNETWYGTPGMWDALKKIRDLGHEIGLHMDPFHLITKYGDMFEGLEASLADMAANRFNIRTITLHGDSRAHIKAHKLQDNDFFSDEFRQSKWDGVAPEGDEMLADHVHQYKHKRLFKRFGIKFVADVNLVRRGKLLTRGAMMYLSDNQRRIRIGNIDTKIESSGILAAPDLFAIPQAFADEAVSVLKQRPFLALFHPQWYR